MFNARAFASWGLVFLGACSFALLFATLIAAADLVLDGFVHMNWRIFGFGLGAFLGYVGVAYLVREEETG